MTRLRDIAIPASAHALDHAQFCARTSYYFYYFGSFSGRYA